MDHVSGTRLQHHHKYPKDWNTLSRPRTNVFGLIDHSNKKKIISPYMDVFSHDSNMVGTQLIRWLGMYRSSSETRRSTYLHIQGDNAVKDNKNKYLFGTIGCILHEEVFDIIDLEMNEKGHTHTDIDALFRWISQLLNKCSCPTWSHYLETYLAMAFKNMRFPPKVLPIDYVFDIKNFLEPYLLDIEYFSGYRAFRFQVRTLRP